MKKTLFKLLSYNIQVGIQTRHFADYIIALQEVDGGSIRSNHINQVQLLANYSGFPHWYHQCNRNLGKLAQQSNGLLSRLPISKVTDHKLPSRIPGRGAIEVTIGDNNEYLIIFIAHLSLSARARKLQVEYLANQMRHLPYVILMGDLNCSTDELLRLFTLQGVNLISSANSSSATFPSWQPRHQFDQVVVSPNIEIITHKVLPNPISDHLPVALEVLIPDSILKTREREDGMFKYNSTHHCHPVRINNELIHYQNRGN